MEKDGGGGNGGCVGVEICFDHGLGWRQRTLAFLRFFAHGLEAWSVVDPSPRSAGKRALAPHGALWDGASRHVPSVSRNSVAICLVLMRGNDDEGVMWQT